ncbi:CAP-Gly domain-containing linker 1-like [Chlorella sorokiniana]|uniref:CAP-Gly domain-containing linker 1-like n=1 Tax=Chlorella sorokiniana TaxID=3076 RepID=A0A2P6TH50_CHLSO|nr:CAP-Gly domain-containing linker 1-like [Chlorella sorokiniana]|eukprot:PRW33596.1 CAP-Gly domain-containing linker 1-like [Chlorella sorokiniana]
MKKELADWRVRMNQQVEGYRADLTSLQTTLTTEIGGLRSELADVKARIRAQLEANGESIASLHARGDPSTRAELEGSAATVAAAAGGKARG